jgi:mono/diheme cytochrome c family protein
MRIAIVVFGTAFQAFLGSAPGALAAEDVSFGSDVMPIIKQRCVMCHLTGAEPGKIKLHPKAAYASLVGVPSEQSPLKRVEPGRPEDSYLFRKVEGTHVDAGGLGARMPITGSGLSDEELGAIRDWIAQGAPDN